MPVDRLTIANRALYILQANPISSLDDGSVAAGLVADNWALSLEGVNQLHQWTFARARATLASTDAPDFGRYTYAFTLPTDPYCMIPRILNPTYANPQGDEYRIEGRSLLTNASTANLTYTKRLEDEDLVHAGALFGDAVAYSLASFIAPNLQRSSKELQVIEYRLNMALQRAIQADALMDHEKFNMPVELDYLDARDQTNNRPLTVAEREGW